MSDLEKAAQVVYESCYGRNLHPGQVSSIVRGLNDAGLLAPDLPEPYRPGVFKVVSPHLDVRSVQAAGDQITLHGYKTRHASVGEARRLALALLAACEYAEKEQDNE